MLFVVLIYHPANKTPPVFHGAWELPVDQVATIEQGQLSLFRLCLLGLYGVSALSPQDAWAVGYYYPEGQVQAHPLTLQWDGRAWTVSPSSVYAGTLSAVVAISPTDVWAVGSEEEAALTMHYDGTSWSQMPVERVRETESLDAVAAASPNEVWTVGSVHATDSGNEYLVVRWDGKSWTRVTLPFPSAEGYLTGVAATSTRDVWITGFRRISTPSSAVVSVAFHWDGKSWTDLANPQLWLDQWFEAVVAISNKEIWAVGGGSTYSKG